MKTNRYFGAALILALALAGLAIVNSSFTSFAQGTLTPPGAPAPTMKTLSQIEPRTPISSTPFTITSSGSYYLTTNLSVTSGNAITVSASGVTLDLNGFTLSSTEASPSGVGVQINFGSRDVTIFNGHIRGGVTNNGSNVYGGPGFASGIHGVLTNILVSHVTVSGCLQDGINLDAENTTVVEDCVVQTVGNFVIWASTVERSSAIDCGGHAIIGDQITDCRGVSGNMVGILCEVSAVGCYGQSGTDTGIGATTAQNCYGVSGSSVGLGATTAQNCYGYSGSNVGINADVAQNCYGYSGGSGQALNASYTAIGCYASSSSGIAISTTVANNCVAICGGNGTAIKATIGIGCFAVGGTNDIVNKYNMP
jgi:hypothetical protein